MHIPRSRSVPPRDTSSRGGAHRRRANSTRWWVVACAITVLVTGTGLATAELNAGPPTQPVAEKTAPTGLADTGDLATEDPAGMSQGDSPSPSKGSKSPSDEPTEEESSSEKPKDEFASLRDGVVRLVNEERASAGCGKVSSNDKLVAAATGHSEDMAANNYFDHTSRDGRTFSDRAAAEGYDAAIGENIAAGQTSAESVMDSWMNSEGHRANILNCDAKAIGMGVDKSGDGTRYWTQVFGSQ
ncbi:MAG: CAP domain-containing protein [Stackebrandtia sp.]